MLNPLANRTEYKGLEKALVGIEKGADTEVFRRYAKALIDLADDNKSLPVVEKDMQALSSLIQESDDFRHFLESPLINRDTQTDVVRTIADKAGYTGLIKNFLGVVARNRRLRNLPQIVTAFQDALDERRGAVKATVRVVQDLTAKQRKDLEKNLSDEMDAKVTVDVRIDESILGGMVVTVGSQMIDDSVARKLENLRQAMERSNDDATISPITQAS